MTIGYRELADALRAAIVAGDYPPSTTLPRQQDLAATFEVNVGTVRRAVAVLESEGLVTAVRRRGTVVRPRPPMRRLGVDRYARRHWKSGLVAFGVDREASGRSWSPHDQTQTVRLIPADAAVAEAFDVDEGSLVYERARLVKDAGDPTHVLTSYYLPADVEGTDLTDDTPGPAGRGGGFAVLTARGLEPDQITETFLARMPTPGEVATLALPEGEPVVVLTRLTVTAAGRLIEYARGIHAASRFSWTYQFKIPD